jgi:hypothetical protein
MQKKEAHNGLNRTENPLGKVAFMSVSRCELDAHLAMNGATTYAKSTRE